jgi:hypothetical protein
VYIHVYIGCMKTAYGKCDAYIVRGYTYYLLLRLSIKTDIKNKKKVSNHQI